MWVRPAVEDDLPACGRIFARSVAHLIERYRPEQMAHLPVAPDDRLWLYRHLLATGTVFVAEDPEPVGFAAAIVRDGVWFLSQLWVLPDRLGTGIGSALLDESLAWGRGSSAFTVVASPHPAAQTLYLRASMYPLWLLVDLASGASPAPEMPDGLQPLAEEDQPWVDRLDREVRGAARPEDHGLFRARATGFALRREGEPRGYVYVWPGGRIGPAAAHEPSVIPILIRAGRHLAGGESSATVPSPNWTALRDLVGAGSVPTGSNTLMASRPLGDWSRYVPSGGALG